jgi:uncharacterized metal-binding protein YceD (DUF177 family)
MEKMKNYDVAFSGLKVGRHQFEFEIAQNFFELFEISDLEFTNTKVLAKVLLTKHNSFLEFEFELEGTIDVLCDLTAEAYSEPIFFENRILVNFADAYDDSNEDVISIPRHETSFNIAHQLYEGILLSVPMKKIKPGIGDDSLAFLADYSIDEDQLNQLEDQQDRPQAEEKEIDPRWAALLKLKDNNNPTDN